VFSPITQDSYRTLWNPTITPFCAPVLPENLIMAQMGVPRGELAYTRAANSGERLRNEGVLAPESPGLRGTRVLQPRQLTQANWFKSSGRAAIAMMQTADLWNRDRPSFGWMLDSTWYRSIAFQRKMSA